MSKKFSPTSISSKLSQSKKQSFTKQNERQQRQSQKNSSSGQSLSQSSERSSDLSSSKNSLTHQKVMEQAIEKASCLIELLTRQNSESKLYIEDLLEQVDKFKSEQIQNEAQYHQLLSNVTHLEEENKNLHKQNQELLFQLQKIKIAYKDQSEALQQLDQTKNKNKKLHQKIAFLTKTSIDINKELEQLKKSFKSLQNQNIYLLNELKKFQSKENIFHQNISVKQSLFERKLNDVETTKEAFACRTQELKLQNRQLWMEIEKLRKEKYDLQIISRESMQTLDVATKKLESFRYVDERVHRIYDKIKLGMDEMASNAFLKGQKTAVQKLEEIEILVTYRLQHMESLMKQICDRVQKPEWKSNLRELGEAKVLAQRLSTYLSELTNRPVLTV